MGKTGPKFVSINSLANNSYNRAAAVEYALTYALNPNPNFRYIEATGEGGGDCTNFISQCLYAGGAPMIYGGARPWWYRRNNPNNPLADTWSVSWSVAHSLYWDLKVRGKSNLWGLRGIEVSSVDLLELGDIIQYVAFDDVIRHSVIITDYAIEEGRRVPLVSQHTYDGLNVPYLKEWAKSMHFMKISVVK